MPSGLVVGIESAAAVEAAGDVAGRLLESWGGAKMGAEEEDGGVAAAPVLEVEMGAGAGWVTPGDNVGGGGVDIVGLRMVDWRRGEPRKRRKRSTKTYRCTVAVAAVVVL